MLWGSNLARANTSHLKLNNNKNIKMYTLGQFHRAAIIQGVLLYTMNPSKTARKSMAEWDYRTRIIPLLSSLKPDNYVVFVKAAGQKAKSLKFSQSPSVSHRYQWHRWKIAINQAFNRWSQKLNKLTFLCRKIRLSMYRRLLTLQHWKRLKMQMIWCFKQWNLI
jgi:hypothetical protein